MKKFLAILMVLILVSGALFAVDPVNALTINTAVSASNSIKLSAAALTVGTWGAVGADSALTLSFTSADSETVPESQSGYVNLRTNKPSVSGYLIKISGAALASTTEGVSTKIGYTITGDSGLSATGTTPLSAATLFSITNSDGGMRVLPKQFTVALNSTDWLAATQDSAYTTTVTFELVTN